MSKPATAAKTSPARPAVGPAAPGRWERIPAVPLLLTVLFFGVALLPRVRENPKLLWSVLGAGGFLLAWSTLLWLGTRLWGQRFRIERVKPVKNHYIQASVQIVLYIYWGQYWSSVYEQVPLILSQFVFLYAFDALLSWSRGRAWRLGFGPVPIVLSTNVFLWFVDDWFAFQYLLVATGALGKEFIKWRREGRLTHIFNPSAFTLALFSLVLIVTGTSDNTLVGPIAQTVGEPPNIYLVVFCLGLIVQYFFAITLMTVSAAATLLLLNAVYTGITGNDNFVFTNIPAPVFIGFHLLVTDPSTSPRTNAGRILFGALYAALTFLLFPVLHFFGAPTVYDKLLPIPLLNLSVQLIDRWAARGPLGAFSRWEARFVPAKRNLAYMGCWLLLFAGMLGTDYIQTVQPGTRLEFWQQAMAEGRPGASIGYVEVLKTHARDGSAYAWNELGTIYLAGEYVPQDTSAAVHYFARASKLGNLAGSANLVSLFLGQPGATAGPEVSQAFDQLAAEAARGGSGAACYLLGLAHETGRGRPKDFAMAQQCYRDGCQRGDANCCQGVQRLASARKGS
ncbi:MAG: RnfABCDGE type electron transport complex subunit D [Planctomycetota bacterium]